MSTEQPESSPSGSSPTSASTSVAAPSGSSAQPRRPSGAAAKTAAGFGTFLAVAWVVPSVLALFDDRRHTDDTLMILEIIVAAVPLAVGAFGVFEGKRWGRWTLLAGFALGIVQSLPAMIIAGAVITVPVGTFVGAATLVLSIAGIVLLLRRSTGEHLAPRRAAGIPIR
jgi:hypothetical protein